MSNLLKNLFKLSKKRPNHKNLLKQRNIPQKFHCNKHAFSMNVTIKSYTEMLNNLLDDLKRF